jgi:hypothetical protein
MSSHSETAESEAAAELSFDSDSMIRRPGETILSDDWNKLVREIGNLKKYINSMTETTILTGLASGTGEGFALNDKRAPGHDFGTRAVGLISLQWLPQITGDVAEICTFGITSSFETIEFWACADNGDKETLDVFFEYKNDSMIQAGEKLFINSRANLSMPNGNNKYSEYLSAPGGYWYKYELRNKAPKDVVRLIKFVNVNKECVPRIGNVLHLTKRIKPLE